MAAVGRTGETSSVSSNIYDNTNKEITPAKVRDALAVLIESNFNLVDDELKNLKYDATRTLSQMFTEGPKVGTVKTINVGENEALTVTGIISSATTIAHNGTDMNINIMLSESITGKVVIPTLIYTSGDYNSNNDICTPVLYVVSSTNIRIGLRKVAAVGTNLTLQIIVL